MDVIHRALEDVKLRLPMMETKLDEPMKGHTSFKIGGPVRVMLFPGDTESLTQSYKLLSEHGITPYVIGNGTNILASDKTLETVVLNTSKLININKTGAAEITAESGVLLSRLAILAYEHGLSGLEFAHGIPGSLGGAVVMNAGAYGGEIKDVVVSTRAYSPETGEYTLTGEKHRFSYRHSIFSETGDVVLSSVFRLKKDDKKSIKSTMDEMNTRRRVSQPLDIPSAGSTFKRPADGYAAALIEQAGLKGFSIGGATVSEKHSGFIVNRANASFNDVMALIEHVRETVLKQFGTELALEVKIMT